MPATGAGTFGWISRPVALGAALEAVRGLTPAADRLPYFTGASAASLTTLTAFARTLLDDVYQAAMRGTLGVGTLATLADISTAQVSASALRVVTGTPRPWTPN